MTATRETIWLEHPFKWEYLRKILYHSISRRTFRKGQHLRGIANFYKLVGYRLRASGDGFYYYDIYYLKTTDRDCPNEHPNYAHGKRMPAEAVLPPDFESHPRLVCLADVQPEEILRGEA